MDSYLNQCRRCGPITFSWLVRSGFDDGCPSRFHFSESEGRRGLKKNEFSTEESVGFCTSNVNRICRLAFFFLRRGGRQTASKRESDVHGFARLRVSLSRCRRVPSAWFSSIWNATALFVISFSIASCHKRSPFFLSSATASAIVFGTSTPYLCVRRQCLVLIFLRPTNVPESFRSHCFPFAPSASTELCGLINCTNSARKSYTSLAITFYIVYKMSFTRVGTFYLSISSLRLKGSCSASVNAKNRECEDSSSTEHVQRTDFMNPGGFSAPAPARI